MRYYYCTYCGDKGDYGKERQRGCKCLKCKHDYYLIDIDKEEYDNSIKLIEEYVDETIQAG